MRTFEEALVGKKFRGVKGADFEGLVKLWS
jgi:hypothetical protein